MAQNEWTEDDKEKLFWYLAASYVANVLGLLDETKAAKLSSFESIAGPQAWQESVREQLDVTDDFVKSVFSQCLQCQRSELQAIGFILRGLGCPSADDRLKEVLG